MESLFTANRVFYIQQRKSAIGSSAFLLARAGRCSVFAPSTRGFAVKQFDAGEVAMAVLLEQVRNMRRKVMEELTPKVSDDKHFMATLSKGKVFLRHKADTEGSIDSFSGRRRCKRTWRCGWGPLFSWTARSTSPRELHATLCDLNLQVEETLAFLHLRPVFWLVACTSISTF